MRTATVNSALPWEAIRREWETTEITLAALARAHGLSSPTTLARRRVSEGWIRDADAIEARRSLADVFSDATAIEGVAEAPDSKSHKATVWQPPERRRPDETSELDAEVLLDRRNFSEVLATKSQRDVALALEVQRAGLLLLRRVTGVLQPPGNDEAAETEMLGNLQRLIRVNPDRETLAGLVAAAGKTIDLGQMMERRAIAIDAIGKLTSGTAEPGAGSIVKGAMELLHTMDSATAARMRAWAIDVQRERRQAQIDKATGS
jgi:hypothetical protein